MKEKLCIESKYFEKCRMDFDQCLSIAIREMLKVGSSEGTVSLRVDIQLNKGQLRGREVQSPRISYQVGMNVPHKGKVEGMMDADTYIQQDGADFAVYREADQISMFEEGEQ